MENERDDRSDGFHRRLGFGARPALLMVDMCKAYFTPGSPLFLDRPAVVEHCRTLVSTARACRFGIWWTRVEVPIGATSVFQRKVGALSLFEPDQPMADWLPDLTPDLSREANETVITKSSASAFFNTDLASQLRAHGIDTVVIAGVSTSGCVRASAVDACQHNFVPIVVEQACGDRAERTHRQNLADLDAKYADVEPLQRVVAELRRVVGAG